MPIKAVFFDLGGVIVRTEDPSPREELGRALGKTYSEMDLAVFENQSSFEASLGYISEDQHWRNVVQKLGLPESEIDRVRTAFFAGDRIDWEIVDFLRGLRPTHKTGLISNAWSDLRPWMVSQEFDDAFDALAISAELHIAKPAPEIYHHALTELGVAPSEAVFVDDMPRNVEASQALGMHGVQFHSTAQALAEVRELLKIVPKF
jgi:HAD superfamily hydrolase (TIGR01509 family)